MAEVFGGFIYDDGRHEVVLDDEPSLVGGLFASREFVDIDFTDAHLIGVTFGECTFTRCDFREMHLDSVKFEGCRLEHCDFSGATLVSVSFRFSDLVSCSMTKIRGDEVSFSAARLLRTEVTPSDLSVVREDDDQNYWECFSESEPGTALDLTAAELRRADFSWAIAVGVRFGGSLLVECGMSNALLVNSSFARAKLVDCDFLSAHLIPPGSFDSWVGYATGGGEWVTTLGWDDIRGPDKETDFNSCGIDFAGMAQNGGETGGGTVWPPDFASGPPTMSRDDYHPNWFD